MSLEIYQVRHFSHMKLFAQIPAIISSNNPDGKRFTDSVLNYNPTNNPVHRHLKAAYFIAMRGTVPIGRIAAIKDSLNPQHDLGFFGCFECQNDPLAATALIKSADNWLKLNLCTEMIGPATFNTNQQVGLLIEGFTLGPQDLLPFNPPYYDSLMKNAGLVKETDLLSFTCTANIGIPEKISLISQRLTSRNQVSFTKLNFLNPHRAASLITRIYNESMSENWGFIPITLEESLLFANICRNYAENDLAICVLLNNKPAGILICLPDKVKSRTDTLRVALLGVSPAYRVRGVDAYLLRHTLNCIKKKGYRYIDISMIHQDNTKIIKTLKQFSNINQSRRYRVYTNNHP